MAEAPGARLEWRGCEHAMTRACSKKGKSHTGFGESAGSPSTHTEHLYRVPLIPLEHVLEWIAGGYKMSLVEVNMLSPIQIGKRSFFFLMPNDSMLGPTIEKSIPEGWTVVIDPDSAPEPGQLVLGSIDGSQPIVGVLTMRGGLSYIKPSNPRYPMVVVDRSRSDWCLGRVVFIGVAK
ncbi:MULTISPECIES: LexA family transcriptional regulator [unclassified Pseudomonas]|uniref:LexA family protein n=2 Tax=Pseudomonas TaxID=286 RepID=UPI00128D482F|nr:MULTISPECIES: S24 family peptidase [unclassified Pseudomonas]MPQ68307.1 hypothetical protein [Pseudomonas sp. MWU12-2323]